MRPQDGPQEMERNEATAMHVAWPSCAWLLLRFFPFPVGNPVAAHGTVLGTGSENAFPGMYSVRHLNRRICSPTPPCHLFLHDCTKITAIACFVLKSSVRLALRASAAIMPLHAFAYPPRLLSSPSSVCVVRLPLPPLSPNQGIS